MAPPNSQDAYLSLGVLHQGTACVVKKAVHKQTGACVVIKTYGRKNDKEVGNRLGFDRSRRYHGSFPVRP